MNISKITNPKTNLFHFIFFDAVLLLTFVLFSNQVSFKSSDEFHPGTDRWKIKTSCEKLTSGSKIKNIPLKNLLTLPLLPAKFSSKNYPDKLIPEKTENNLKEGDIISTAGYLHLIALERNGNTKRDGDYHIQITRSPTWSDSCLIVEIPYSKFVKDESLKTLCDNSRKFIRKKILLNETQEPSVNGNIIKSAPYVQITGQLFYDAIHASTMRNPDLKKRKYRGKKGNQKKAMHSYTAWEIHPVTEIKFVKEQ